MQRHLSAATLLLICVHIVNSRVIPLSKRAFSYIANDTVCVVDNAIYYDGDPIPTDDPCEFCRCRPPGFSCVLRECEMKPGCKAIRREGECCPEYQCGCEHNGNFFKDGDKIPIAESPCYSCYCQGSSITCALADCKFRFDCPPEYVIGDCCPRYDHCPPESSIFTRPPHETLTTTINGTQVSFETTTPLEIKDNLQTTKSVFTESATISPAVSTSSTAVESDKKDIDQSIVTTSPTIVSVASVSLETFNSTTKDYENERFTVEPKVTMEASDVTTVQEQVDTTTQSLLGDGTISITTTQSGEIVDQKLTTEVVNENKSEAKVNVTEATTIGSSSVGTVTSTSKDQIFSSSEGTSSQILKLTTVGGEVEPLLTETTTLDSVEDVETTSKVQNLGNNSSRSNEDVTSTVRSTADTSTTKISAIEEEKPTTLSAMDETSVVNKTRTTFTEDNSIDHTRTLSPEIRISTEKLEVKPLTELTTEILNVDNETTLASKIAPAMELEKKESIATLPEESQTTEIVVNSNLPTGTSSMLT